MERQRRTGQLKSALKLRLELPTRGGRCLADDDTPRALPANPFRRPLSWRDSTGLFQSA